MDTPLQEQWAKKSRFLTQALIFSGALNIGLLTSFVYFIVHSKKEAVAFELQPAAKAEKKESNGELLSQFATMSYAELLDLLENKESVEEGYKKRDLALASLVTFHFVNLEKALQGSPLQKRGISFQRKDGPEMVDITVYPGLSEDQFQGVLHFLKTEKFPFTTQGLFFELQNSKMPRDTSLLEAFYLSSEFTSMQTLFTRMGVLLPSEYLVELIAQGDWKTVHQFSEEQKQAQDLTPLRLKNLLISYIKCRSILAAKILLEWDREFILKKFEDAEFTAFLELLPHKTASFELFLKDVITSSRSDAIWKKAAEKLYAFANLPMPDPYDHNVTLQTFAKDRMVARAPEAPRERAGEKPAPVSVSTNGKLVHKIQPGDNLWKIARKYKVTIEAIRKANRIESDKLRPGKELIIPVKEEPRNSTMGGRAATSR